MFLSHDQLAIFLEANSHHAEEQYLQPQSLVALLATVVSFAAFASTLFSTAARSCPRDVALVAIAFARNCPLEQTFRQCDLPNAATVDDLASTVRLHSHPTQRGSGVVNLLRTLLLKTK